MSEKYQIRDRVKGYIRKQDITNVEPGYLVQGSQNVITNESERIAVRKGYTKLEEQGFDFLTPGIQSSYDWQTSFGEDRHVRGWNARAVVLSVTANTITKSGTTTWAQVGFNTSGTVWINGIPYTYSGGSATTTLTGVAPNPSSGGVVLDDEVLQGELEFLYFPTPEWRNLTTNRKRGLFNFTTVFATEINSTNEGKRFMRFVSGENNMFEWSGGVTTFASAAATTITKQGNTPWRESSFYEYATEEATITIVDYTGLAGDTVAININGTTTTLTEGVDWTAATSNEATSASLTTALNTVTGIVADSFAQVAEGRITIVNFAGLAGDTVQIDLAGENGFTSSTTLTEGVDWTAAVSNAATATSLATAIATIANVTAAAGGDTVIFSTSIADGFFVTNVALSNPVDMISTPANFSLALITIEADPGFSIRALTLSDSTNMTRTPNAFVLKQVEIDGIVYTYNGGENTITLTGVTPNPTLGGHTAGDVVHQVVRQYNNADIGLSSTFNNDLISTFRNQLYIASESANTVLVSAPNDFEDFTFTTPVREVGEGDVLVCNDSIRGMIPQENTLYIYAGKDQIYKINYELSADLQGESITVDQLDTAPLMGAMSQSTIGKIKNAIVYISNEPAFNQLSQVEFVNTPQNVNMSDPIKIEFETLDFTNASIFYFDYNIYIPVPAEDILLIYNLAMGYWEAPQILPISRIFEHDGLLYFHSSRVRQTYKLFDGYSDDGNPIAGKVYFSYENYGMPANYKTFNEMYTEGYISSNTDLTLIINYEIDGCQTQFSRTLAGRNQQFVCIGAGASLGKKSLGKRSLAGRGPTDDEERPPKFRWIPTWNHFDFYEVQYGFESDGVDQRWEILRWGPNVVPSDSLNVEKKQ